MVAASAKCPFLTWNLQRTVSEQGHSNAEPAMTEWCNGSRDERSRKARLRNAYPAAQGLRVSPDDPGLRQSGRRRRRAGRGAVEGLPSSPSAARLGGLPCLAGPDRETRLLAVERARVAAAPASAVF